MTHDELRKIWVAYWRECDRIQKEIERIQALPNFETHTFSRRTMKIIIHRLPLPEVPAMPEVLRGLTCGAKTKRKGTPCKLTDLWGNGRCKFHGGLSTGPRTESGKNRSKMNGFLPKKPRIPKKAPEFSEEIPGFQP